MKLVLLLLGALCVIKAQIIDLSTVGTDSYLLLKLDKASERCLEKQLKFKIKPGRKIIIPLVKLK